MSKGQMIMFELFFLVSFLIGAAACVEGGAYSGAVMFAGVFFIMLHHSESLRD